MSDNAEYISNRPDDVTDGLSVVLKRIGLTAEIFMRADLCGEWAMDTSGHRKAAFHLVEKGCGWLHTEDSDEPRLLSSGDFVVFPHDKPHCISSGPEKPPIELVNQLPSKLEGEITTLLCGFFVFRDQNAWPILDNLPEIITLRLLENGGRNSTYFLLQLIIGELEQRKPGRGAALNQLAHLLFVMVLRSEMKAGIGEGLLYAFVDPQIGRALNLIHLNMQEDWTVEKLAKQVGMSRSIFSKKFAEIVGKTPMHYLTEWRMQEATDMLKTTNASIATIAYEVGYSSEMAFRKAFRKITGEPPGQVRRAR